MRKEHYCCGVAIEAIRPDHHLISCDAEGHMATQGRDFFPCLCGIGRVGFWPDHRRRVTIFRIVRLVLRTLVKPKQIQRSKGASGSPASVWLPVPRSACDTSPLIPLFFFFCPGYLNVISRPKALRFKAACSHSLAVCGFRTLSPLTNSLILRTIDAPLVTPRPVLVIARPGKALRQDKRRNPALASAHAHHSHNPAIGGAGNQLCHSSR